MEMGFHRLGSALTHPQKRSTCRFHEIAFLIIEQQNALSRRRTLLGDADRFFGHTTDLG